MSTPGVLRCLFDEHRHLSALARALEKRVHQEGRLSPSDYFLMRDIVAYMHDYPDHVHHPTENLLFEKLLKRKPSQSAAVKRLLRDHQAVEQETQSLMDLLDLAIDESTREREQEVRLACIAFVNHQRAHMQFENTEMFPVAIGALTASDWREIEQHFERTDDPLFGRAVGSQHRLLYEYLVDPVSRIPEKFTVSRLFSMERLIRTVDVLEQGHNAWWFRIGELGTQVSGETRKAAMRTLRPTSMGSVVGTPLNFAVFLGKSLFDCSGDLLRIYSTTAKDTLALYSRRDPDE